MGCLFRLFEVKLFLVYVTDMINSNKLTTILLLIFSAIVILDLGYLIYHEISWSNELMMIVWYGALFLPVYLIARFLPPTIKRPFFNVMGVIGLVIFFIMLGFN